ncbi:peroxiredoxin family protein [Chitinophaga defluvii]|uniref:TlpA disulfide reductase family protein n=1 Tax=Chitinophaga defluvii TaxID=3163343 RepID=A0ABV2TA67_9BACT
MKHLKRITGCKAIALLLLAGLSATAQQPKKYITVSGKIKFPPPAEHQAKFPFLVQKQGDDGRITLDTIHLKPDGTYSVKLDATRPQFYILNEFEWDRLTVWANKDDLRIDFRGEDTAKIKIKNPPYVFIEGSQENNFLNDINFMNYRNYQATIAISQLQYKASKANDTALARQLGEHMMWLYDDMDQRVKLAIRMNQHSPVVLYGLDFISPRKDKVFIQEQVDRLAKKYPWFKEVQEKKASMAKAEAIAKKTAIGAPAMEFTQNDVNGKPIKLSDYKGKYVLVDFWASWCGPCRAENPNVLENYEKYHDKGFEILGVSLDDKKENWVKAIKDDGLTWQHVSDLKGWKNEVAKQYNIRAVPSNFLLDKEGKIIAVNLRAEDLGKKLAEIYDK